MMPRLRSALVIAALAALAAACSGTQAGSTSAGRASAEQGPFTQMPLGNENRDSLFLDADAAFNAGDYVSAQRDFGTLYIIAPNYRGGVPAQAIDATCERMGVNCMLVKGRLDLMREVYYNRWGPMDAWYPQQRNDYFAILGCYERSLSGDPLGASASATPVIGSPDPIFAQSARACVEAADAVVAAAERQRQADAALLVWFDNHPCMQQNRRVLMAAFEADDWETFVTTYPAYAACADPLNGVIDAGVLAGDPRVGVEHDIAWTDMSEVDAIMEDYAFTFEATVDALNTLQQDPEYNRLVVAYNNLDFEESRLVNQITSLEAARDALTGGNRAGVEQQISTLQTGLVAVRSQKREVMGDINRIRRDLDLRPRETP